MNKGNRVLIPNRQMNREFDIDLKITDISGYKPKPLGYGTKNCSHSCSGCCSGTCSSSNCCGPST